MLPCRFFIFSETDNLLKQPYLATAMRLSLPTSDDDANREELLKEIDALMADISSFSEEQPSEVPVSLSKIQKRYLEWPGKRSVKKADSKSRLNFKPSKTWNRQSEKQVGYPSVRQNYFKRWSEFVGKRYTNLDDPFAADEAPLTNRKRWYEFVGKRYDPALFMHYPKRYLEFVGRK